METMTLDKLIDICGREHKRGLATAKYSKYDDGYATAFKLCLSFAKELKQELKQPEPQALSLEKCKKDNDCKHYDPYFHHEGVYCEECLRNPDVKDYYQPKKEGE